MSFVIEVSDLSRVFRMRLQKAGKRRFFARAAYKDVTAVRNLNFSIEAGEKVAFIGPNGAGKSTTLRMLSGLLAPTSGTAQVCGFVPWKQTRALSRHIGLVFGQKTHLWPALSVRDNFDLLARVYDLAPQDYQEQRDKLIEMFALQEFLGQQARTLSLGQRMRSDIAAALLHKPKVLFLDEPTIGLDVTAKALLRDHLRHLEQSFETTLLLTSHDTDDIERICERVIVIDHGEKLLDTPLDALQGQYAKHKTLKLTTEQENPVFLHPHTQVEAQSAHQLCLKVDVSQVSMESVVAQCLQQFQIRDISIENVPLEEIIRTIYEGQASALWH
ncbi:MAG: ATP-binding cassette domain-containing protein [Alphaproteobacteria bacterium]|nr:ATP-binding cassette domain-containing protein [Alphaproteobacteria bacterium]